MFLRPKFSLIALLSSVLVVAGCGDGQNSEPTIQSDSDFTLPPEPAPQLSAAALTGEIAWDFMLAGSGENLSVYRTSLASQSRGIVKEGDTLSNNLVVNGLDTADLYSPALVSAKGGQVTLHSRIDGNSYPLVDFRRNVRPCDMQAYADEDLSYGLVFLSVSDDKNACPGPETGMVKSYGVIFGEGGTSTWSAVDGSQLVEVVYNSEGNIDFIVMVEPVSKTLRVYSPEGAVLRELTGTYRLPEIMTLGPRGVTRDDRYLGILRDGRLYITTAAQFIDSGIAAVSPTLPDLTLNSFFRPVSGPVENRLAILQDENTVYGIDQVTRDIETLADFSDRQADSYFLQAVKLIDNTLVAVLNNGDGEVGESAGEVWTVELTTAEAPQLRLEAESVITPSVYTGAHYYLGFVEEKESEFAYKTLIVGSGGSTRIPEGSTDFFMARNYENGGEELVVIGLRSENYSLDTGFLSPELWAVNTATSQYGAMVKRLSGYCLGFLGRKALGDRMHVLSACDLKLRVGVLDMDQRSLDYLIRL